MENLHLPSLRGQIGEWAFFSTIMKIKDIVINKRIITVAESKELYSDNINHILQRELKESRISSLKRYLLNNDERFFSSLIVAIHKGTPEWSDFDIEERFKIDNTDISEDQINFIGNKTGILTLSGSEEIFALDGQHRLAGLRAAYSANTQLGEEELSLIFLVHNHQLKERTRRLFTVLNKYAEKPKGAELIILDEDDAAAIIARRLVTEHIILKAETALSDSNTGSIPNNDLKSFTTLVTIHQINKVLFNKSSSFYTQRPSDNELGGFYNMASEFWDSLFAIFPEIMDFITSDKKILIDGVLFNRNNDTGGSLLLRPVGQVLFARVYKEFEKGGASKLAKFKKDVRLIDFDLNGPIWKYLYWNEKMLPKNDLLKKNLFNYLLNNFRDTTWIHAELTKIYKSYNLEYKHDIIPLINHDEK